MSRRITVFVLAASASLIATQASADRECFENSCSLPETVAQPAEVAPPSAIDETSAPQAPVQHTATPDPAAPVVEPPEGARAEASRPDATKSDATKSDAPKSDAPKFDAVRADAPKVVMPEVVRAEAPKPAAPAPKINVVHKLAPASERSKVVAAPPRLPVMMTSEPPAQSPAAREPVRLVQHSAEPRRAPEYRLRARTAAYVQPDGAAPVATVSGGVLVAGPQVAGSVIVVGPSAISPGYIVAPPYTVAPNARIISIDSDD